MSGNSFPCGQCAHFDGSMCTNDGSDRYEDEIVTECGEFEFSIYYGG